METKIIYHGVYHLKTMFSVYGAISRLLATFNWQYWLCDEHELQTASDHIPFQKTRPSQYCSE